ncbi:MAG: hypothetical protein L7S55_09235 [Luminiphilus sp.]|nr:hypothetical protein [Luminiphilus sp.]
MSWKLFAGSVEFIGNATLVVVILMIGLHKWPHNALKRLAAALAVYASTNMFYAAAYVGRLTERWQWWDTPVEKAVVNIQVFSMWALLLFGIEALVKSSD